MRDLIRILLIAGLGYGLYAYFIQQQNDVTDPLAEEGSASRCVQRLDQGGDAVERAILKNSTKPVDTAAWRQEKVRLDRKVAVARAACSCQGEACRRGNEASTALRQLVVDMNDAYTLGETMPEAGDHLDAFRRLQEQTQALNR